MKETNLDLESAILYASSIANAISAIALVSENAANEKIEQDLRRGIIALSDMLSADLAKLSEIVPN